MNEIGRFLRFFGQNHVLAYFDVQTNKIIPGCGVVFGETSKLEVELPTLEGITAHLTVNETDGRGRKFENIIKPRVYFADFDRELEKEEIKEVMLKYRPQLVVRTSPKKYHLYWKCEDGITFQYWETVQRGINQILKCEDNSTWVRTHTMRIPGMERICKDGKKFTPSIVWLEPKLLPYPISIEDLFPFVHKIGEQVKNETIKKDSEVYRAVLNRIQSDRIYTIEGIKKGERNQTLYMIGKSMVSSQAVGTLDELDNDMGRLNSSIPLDIGGPLEDFEVRDIVKSAWSRGVKSVENKKRVTMEILDSEEIGEEEYVNGKVEENTQKIRKEYEYNLEGIHEEEKFSTESIIERFLQRYGMYLVKVEDKGIYCFDDGRGIWVKQSRTEYTETKKYFQIILNEMVVSYEFCQRYGVNKQGEPDRNKLEKERERFRNIKMMPSYTIGLFTSSGIKCMKEGDFDADPKLFYCENGVLNLITGELRKVRAQDYLLKNSDIRWNSEALAPRWDKFLTQIFYKNDEPQRMIDCLQDIFGYSLSGDMSVQAVYCHVGSGANGKSTVLRVLKKLCGDYSRKLGPDTLNGKGDAKFERLANRLKGLRTVILDDIETTLSINEAFLKNLTDTEVEARALFNEHMSVRNRAKVHMGVNALPSPESNSDGFFRRMRIISYNRKFINDPVETENIDRMMVEEIEGILVWAVKGYQRFKTQGGMTTPNEVLMDAQEYRDQTSVSNKFLEELFDISPNGQFISCKEALDIVKEFCEKESIGVKISPISLGIAVREVFGLRSERRGTGKHGESMRIYRLISKNKNSVL